MKTTSSKTIRISLALAACLFVFSACIRKKADYGKEITKNIPVGEFEAVTISGNVTVHIIQGKECLVKMKGKEGLLANTDITVKQGELNIQTKETESGLNWLFRQDNTDKMMKGIDIYITAPNLTKLSQDGIAAITFPDSITLDKLTFTSPGITDLKINSMKVNQLDFSAPGISNVSIKHLTAKNARFTVPGNADLDVNFNHTDTAYFHITGNADAKLTGTTRLPIQTTTEGNAAIKDETTRTK